MTMSETTISREQPHRGDVLILSKWHSGAVGPLAKLLHERGWRAVLMTAESEDRNEDACDEVVRVDWDEDQITDVAEAIASAGVQPAAVVNVVDVLMGWQVQLAEHFGVRGPAPEYVDLVDKSAVRSMLFREGLSQMRFLSCLAGESPAWTIYPAVVKPAVQSGGSAFVRVVHDDTERAAAMRDIAETYGGGASILIEEYITGSEFSLDVVIQDSGLIPLLAVEKVDRGAEETRDRGLLVTPPVSQRVSAAADELASMLEAMVKALGIKGGWLHVEARVDEQRVEIIEINPRCGGGTYMHAVKQRHGLDPLEYQIDLYLPDGPPAVVASHDLNPRWLGLVPLDTLEAGNVRLQFTYRDLMSVPNVIDAIVFEHFVSSGSERENIFTMVLFGGDDLVSLRATERLVYAATPYWVEAAPKSS